MLNRNQISFDGYLDNIQESLCMNSKASSNSAVEKDLEFVKDSHGDPSPLNNLK